MEFFGRRTPLCLTSPYVQSGRYLCAAAIHNEKWLGMDAAKLQKSQEEKSSQEVKAFRRAKLPEQLFRLQFLRIAPPRFNWYASPARCSPKLGPATSISCSKASLLFKELFVLFRAKVVSRSRLVLVIAFAVLVSAHIELEAFAPETWEHLFCHPGFASLEAEILLVM